MAYEKKCVVFLATNVSQHSNSIDGVQQRPKHPGFYPYYTITEMDLLFENQTWKLMIRHSCHDGIV
jgi:hypothetical protein